MLYLLQTASSVKLIFYTLKPPQATIVNEVFIKAMEGVPDNYFFAPMLSVYIILFSVSSRNKKCQQLLWFWHSKYNNKHYLQSFTNQYQFFVHDCAHDWKHMIQNYLSCSLPVIWELFRSTFVKPANSNVLSRYFISGKGMV